MKWLLPFSLLFSSSWALATQYKCGLQSTTLRMELGLSDQTSYLLLFDSRTREIIYRENVSQLYQDGKWTVMIMPEQGWTGKNNTITIITDAYQNQPEKLSGLIYGLYNGYHLDSTFSCQAI